MNKYIYIYIYKRKERNSGNLWIAYLLGYELLPQKRIFHCLTVAVGWWRQPSVLSLHALQYPYPNNNSGGSIWTFRVLPSLQPKNWIEEKGLGIKIPKLTANIIMDNRKRN